jgi:tol-pal system protein YbgF
MITTWKYAVTAIFAASVLAACAGVQPNDPYAVKVRQLEKQVKKLQQQPTGQNLANLSDKLDTIERQIRQLRGHVQTASHNLQQTNRRQRDLYQDIDQRLHTLELKAGVQQPSSAAQPPAGFGRSSSAGQPSSTGRPSSTGQAATMNPHKTATPAPSGNAGQGAAATPSPGARKDYQHAFDLLKQGRYEDAASAFESFLKQHSDSSLADNAQYWLGEVNYVDRQFKPALAAFQKVLDKYPHSAKAPDALLKVGYCQYELSQYDNARSTLNKVVSQYPDSTAARLASQRLKSMKNNGH